MAVALFVQGESTHRDDLTIFNYDSDGNSAGPATYEAYGASAEDAIYWSYYIVYRITDAEGVTHELYESCTYAEVDHETGEWTKTGEWSVSSEEIDAFFLAHTN